MVQTNPTEPIKLGDLAGTLQADVFFFNGYISRQADLHCLEAVVQHKANEKAVLILVTNGGDPDAAYKMARFFQTNYSSFTVIVSGLCKSAGTLLAIGATELAFSSYGELGPLDVQIAKADMFGELRSGLTISSALLTLQSEATKQYLDVMAKLIHDNAGLISIATATEAASKLVSAIYAPVFGRIDPEEVGARSRDMQIAIDYGRRLAAWSENIRPSALELLAQTYSSHSFVIDKLEAETLFNRVRTVSETEEKIVSALGWDARFPGKSQFRYLNSESLGKETSRGTEPSREGSSASAMDGDSTSSTSAPNAQTSVARKRGPRRNGSSRPGSAT